MAAVGGGSGAAGMLGTPPIWGGKGCCETCKRCDTMPLLLWGAMGMSELTGAAGGGRGVGYGGGGALC